MDQPCFCGSGLMIDDCCYKKYPSIKVGRDLDQSSSTYDLWGMERRWVCIALTKLLKEHPHLDNRNIVIFGAGKCTDLPMDYICSNFSEVVLVDIDSSALEKSKQYIPQHLHNKVVWVQLDVTGLFKKIMDEFIPNLVEERYDSIEEALLYFKELNQNIPELLLPKEITDRMPFAISISDLIITQLFCPFYFAAIYPQFRRMDKKASTQATDYEDLNDFINNLNYQHLQLLHKVTETEKGKIIVLVDTFMFGKEIDGSDSDFNKVIASNPNYLNHLHISMKDIAKWMEKYTIAGSNILYPIHRFNYSRFQIEKQMWWWWHFSGIKFYLVMTYVFTPYNRDIDLMKKPEEYK